MPAMRIHVLVVEATPHCLRRWMQAVVGDPALVLVGVAPTAARAQAVCAAMTPEVCLVNLDLPQRDGLGLIQWLVTHQPSTECLAVGPADDLALALSALEAGAAGHLPESVSVEELRAAIRTVCTGGAVVAPHVARSLLRRLRQVPPTPVPANENPVWPDLSEREREVLRLVAKGLSFDHIADLLGISHHTVVAHVKHVYRKLSVHSRGEAVFEASQMGLL